MKDVQRRLYVAFTDVSSDIDIVDMNLMVVKAARNLMSKPTRQSSNGELHVIPVFKGVPATPAEGIRSTLSNWTSNDEIILIGHGYMDHLWDMDGDTVAQFFRSAGLDESVACRFNVVACMAAGLKRQSTQMFLDPSHESWARDLGRELRCDVVARCVPVYVERDGRKGTAEWQPGSSTSVHDARQFHWQPNSKVLFHYDRATNVQNAKYVKYEPGRPPAEQVKEQVDKLQSISPELDQNHPTRSVPSWTIGDSGVSTQGPSTEIT